MNAAPSLSPAAGAALAQVLRLPPEDRAAVLEAVALAAPDRDPTADRPLGEALARARAAVLQWERDAAAGRPYTPVSVGGVEIVPDGPPGPEGSGELSEPTREAA